VAWWDTWRRSAQAQEFTDTDWDFLLDTALMHHTMWGKARLGVRRSTAVARGEVRRHP
jgi:hypothetical protein